jgi:hypothetical protein
MATLKALSPTTRTSTDFGLWGTVVASVAKSVLQPLESHDWTNTVYFDVSASAIETNVTILVVLNEWLYLEPKK